MGKIGTCLHYINKSFNVVIEKKTLKIRKRKLTFIEYFFPFTRYYGEHFKYIFPVIPLNYHVLKTIVYIYRKVN